MAFRVQLNSCVSRDFSNENSRSGGGSTSWLLEFSLIRAFSKTFLAKILALVEALTSVRKTRRQGMSRFTRRVLLLALGERAGARKNTVQIFSVKEISTTAVHVKHHCKFEVLGLQSILIFTS